MRIKEFQRGGVIKIVWGSVGILAGVGCFAAVTAFCPIFMPIAFFVGLPLVLGGITAIKSGINDIRLNNEPLNGFSSEKSSRSVSASPSTHTSLRRSSLKSVKSAPRNSADLISISRSSSDHPPSKAKQKRPFKSGTEERIHPRLSASRA